MSTPTKFLARLAVTSSMILAGLAICESAARVEEDPEAARVKAQQAEIRKIISAEPDPSLMLEPIPEAPEDKRKKVPPKPERPMPPTNRETASAAQGKSPELSIGGLGGGSAAPAGLGGPIGGAPPAAAGGGAPSTNPLLSLNPAAGPGGRKDPRLGRLHGEAPPSPEVGVILHNKQFFPSRIRLKAGVQTRVYFTTTGDRPAAIVVEQLQVQKWLAKEGAERKPASEFERAKFEVSREVTKQKMTEITFEPRRGTYSFHDAISGAKGQIVVE